MQAGNRLTMPFTWAAPLCSLLNFLVLCGQVMASVSHLIFNP
jgi:hypothetical protein